MFDGCSRICGGGLANAWAVINSNEDGGTGIVVRVCRFFGYVGGMGMFSGNGGDTGNGGHGGGKGDSVHVGRGYGIDMGWAPVERAARQDQCLGVKLLG